MYTLKLMVAYCVNISKQITASRLMGLVRCLIHMYITFCIVLLEALLGGYLTIVYSRSSSDVVRGQFIGGHLHVQSHRNHFLYCAWVPVNINCNTCNCITVSIPTVQCWNVTVICL